MQQDSHTANIKTLTSHTTTAQRMLLYSMLVVTGL